MWNWKGQFDPLPFLYMCALYMTCGEWSSSGIQMSWSDADLFLFVCLFFVFASSTSVWHWANYLTAQRFSFFFCKMGVVIVTIQWDNVYQTFGSILAHRNDLRNGRGTLFIYQKPPFCAERQRKHPLIPPSGKIASFCFGNEQRLLTTSAQRGWERKPDECSMLLLLLDFPQDLHYIISSKEESDN